MTKKAIMSILTIIGFTALAFAPAFTSNHANQSVKARDSSLTYPNAYDTVLWVRRNGSDPGFDYGGANVSPSVGMSYFGTNVLQVTWSYNWTDIANIALFPADTELYIQIDEVAADAIDVADHALTDTRIKGAFIDDFRVGWQNASNMSAIYTGIHHNDVALGYNLTLGLIVYNRNYYVQAPHPWSELSNYFDIIHFWFYPNAYALLYPQFAGYEDAFMEMRSWFPTKEYWLGIYLHYYNVGIYPYDFTYEQMSIASRLIKSGYATKFSVLENFWIQHNPQTSILVQNFIANEVAMNYTSIWNLTTGFVTSYQAGNPLTIDLLTNIEIVWARNYTVTSTHLQQVTATNVTVGAYVIQNTRNGHHVNATISGSNITFLLEPGQSYKIYSQPMTYDVISTRTYIETPTSWNYKLVNLSSILNLNSTLWINNSILQISDHMHKNSMFNSTNPDYGIILNLTNNAKLYLNNATIEPRLRAFPYYLNMTWSNSVAQSRVISLRNSTLACYAGKFYPLGYTTIADTLFFQAQPNGESYYSTFWFNGAGSTNDLAVIRSTIWNYESSGAISAFILAYSLPSSSHFSFTDTTIAGGNIGLWIDMTLSDDVMFSALSIYPTANPSTVFSEYWFQGNLAQSISVEANTTTWSSIELLTGPNITYNVIALEDNVYYGIQKNGSFTDGDFGPTVTFTDIGWGDYVILERYGASISGLVFLILDMLALGLMVGVVGNMIRPLRDPKNRRPEVFQKLLINTVVCIVVGIILITIVNNLVLGG